MFAKTRHSDWLQKLTLLFASAVALIHQQKRSAPQIEGLLIALQTFKNSRNGTATVTADDYVVLRVHRTHGGVLGNLIIIVKVSDLSNMDQNRPLEPDISVSFKNPLGGGSGGRILFVLSKEQAASITSLLTAIPEES
jgi:hypothetical protein